MPHWEPDYVSPISEDGVTFRFGVIVCVGGLLGVVSGMITSVKLRSKVEQCSISSDFKWVPFQFQWIDPIICGVSLLIR